MAVEDYVEAYAREWARENTDVTARLAVDWGRRDLAAVGPELHLITRVLRLHGLLDDVLARELRPHGISRVEYDILSVLLAAGEPHRLRSTDIARRTLTTSGGTSTTLRRLDERGLVTRERDPRDARVTWVGLTDAGAARVRAAAREVVPARSALLQCGDAAAVAPAVERAADALREVLVALGDVPVPELPTDGRTP